MSLIAIPKVKHYMALTKFSKVTLLKYVEDRDLMASEKYNMALTAISTASTCLARQKHVQISRHVCCS